MNDEGNDLVTDRVSRTERDVRELGVADAAELPVFLVGYGAVHVPTPRGRIQRFELPGPRRRQK